MSYSDNDSGSNYDYDSSYDMEEEEEYGEPPTAAAKSRTAAGLSKVAPKKQNHLPTELTVIDGHLAKIRKALHGEDIDRSLSIRVLKAVLTLQRKYRRDVQQRGQSLDPPKKRAIQQTLFSTVSDIPRLWPAH